MSKRTQQLHNRINRKELKSKLQSSGLPRTTLSFYVYARILNPQFFRNHLYITLSELEVLGRIYVATEGVNAQLSVPTSRFKELKRALDDITFLNGCRLNTAIEHNDFAFYKLIIKVRQKIVADGLPDDELDVNNNAKHISAIEFNRLAELEDTMIIDMRNHYESEVGHFQNAICPDVETFRESLPVVEKILIENKDKNILMYCTGGIRCEKATAYYKQKGYDNLYQLDGGIVEYARTANKIGLDNKFVGKNFVFDDRLGERISQDVIAQCHQCGSACDTHVNCANDACHILFIQCESCQETYNGCCSVKCQDFLNLPPEQRNQHKSTLVFNGSKFGKRWKPKYHQEHLK